MSKPPLIPGYDGAEVQVTAETPSTLTELMNRYCDGDVDAFRTLYELVAARLLHYAVCIVGDRASGEDVIQRAFLKVHTARAAYVRGADPLPWLYTIVHRVAVDELRRRRRFRTALSSVPAMEEHAALTGVPEELQREREDFQALSRRTLDALGRLSAGQREALVLIKLHGRSVAEAALITGTSPGAVKVRAHRAYLTLKKLLGVGETPPQTR